MLHKKYGWKSPWTCKQEKNINVKSLSENKGQEQILEHNLSIPANPPYSSDLELVTSFLCGKMFDGEAKMETWPELVERFSTLKGSKFPDKCKYITESTVNGLYYSW